MSRKSPRLISLPKKEYTSLDEPINDFEILEEYIDTQVKKRKKQEEIIIYRKEQKLIDKQKKEEERIIKIENKERDKNIKNENRKLKIKNTIEKRNEKQSKVKFNTNQKNINYDKEIDINLDIENLPSYISFCNNIFTKLGDKIRTNITITTYDNKNNKIENKISKEELKELKLINFDTLCGYIFIRLLRILFYLDFIHDFNKKSSKNVIEQNYKLMQLYDEKYQKDKSMIKLIFIDKSGEALEGFDILDKIDIIKYDKEYLSFDNLDYKLIESDDVQAKNIAKNIISFINILEINEETTDCKIFTRIIENIKTYNKKTTNDVNIFVDAGYSNVNLCPITNSLRELVINDTNSKITFKESILNDYDSATGSSLKKIIFSFINAEKLKSKDKNNINYEYFDFGKINIKLNYKNEKLIHLKFETLQENSSKNNIQLLVKDFFSEDNINIIKCNKSNLKSIKDDLINIEKQKDIDNFLTTSLCKTMGDFCQILLVCHLAQKETNKLYLFFTFDIIASYISSIFNYGTIQEKVKNPITPLSYFINYDNFYGYTKFGKRTKEQIQYKNRNKDKNKKPIQSLKKLQINAISIGIPIKNKMNNYKSYNLLYKEIKQLLNFSKKYNLLINKKLYTNLLKLYMLQILAKKYKIKITERKNNKIVYKSIKKLNKEIRNISKKKLLVK